MLALSGHLFAKTRGIEVSSYFLINILTGQLDMPEELATTFIEKAIAREDGFAVECKVVY